MVFAMLIKIITVFVIVPDLLRISQLTTVLALPADFEFGVMITGTIYLGILVHRMNLVQ